MPERITWDPVKCKFHITFDHKPISEAQELLDKVYDKARTGLGCRVVKQPGACAVCVANDDCTMLPRHIQCRCRPEPFLEGFED
jgi:hypothetical protein